MELDGMTRSTPRAVALILISILIAASLLSGCFPEPEESVTLVIVGGNFLARKGFDPIADAVILIEKDMIVAAGPQSHIPFPKGVETLDARGMWIAPGIQVDDVVLIFGKGDVGTDGTTPADLIIFDTDPRKTDANIETMHHRIRAGIVEWSAPPTEQP